MKRILIVLALVAFASMAFSVSGKIFMRMGVYNDQESQDTNGATLGKSMIGPMFSYWGPGAENNVDLWQNQPGGTGFEVNFDNFGLLYKTRDKRYASRVNNDGVFYTELSHLYSFFSASDAWGAASATADWYMKGAPTPATSPGYIQLKNVSFGKIGLQLGVAPWVLFASDKYQATNGVNTNSDYTANIGYSRWYIDFKFNVPISDNLEIKVVDWDLIFTEFYFGSSSITGITGSYPAYDTNSVNQFKSRPGYINEAWGTQPTITNNNSVNGVKIYVPLHVMFTLSEANLSFDLSPRVIYDTSTYTEIFSTSMASMLDATPIYADKPLTNTGTSTYTRVGGYLRTTFGLNDVLALYLMAGYFYEGGSTLVTGSSAGIYNAPASTTVFTTNTDKVFAYNTLPLYGGIKVKVGPGINMNIGYGANIALGSTDVQYGPGRSWTNTTTYGTIIRTGYLRNMAYGHVAVDPEKQTYGDNLMDVAFLRFGADAKFAQNWTLGLIAAVSLNDGWAYNWYNDGSYNVSSDNKTGVGSSRTMNNWLVFQNFMSYDNNMYVKYEDDVVYIKGTVGAFPWRAYSTANGYQANAVAHEATQNSSIEKNAVTGENARLFNFFTYMDFGYKF